MHLTIFNLKIKWKNRKKIDRIAEISSGTGKFCPAEIKKSNNFSCIFLLSMPIGGSYYSRAVRHSFPKSRRTRAQGESQTMSALSESMSKLWK